MKKHWTKEEDKLLEHHWSETQRDVLFDYFPGRTHNALNYRAQVLGLKANRSISRQIYSKNKNYFSVPNIENSYWAGFIAADGCISEKNKIMSGSLSIALKAEDKNHLEKFANVVNFNGLVRIYKSKSNYKYSCLRIYGIKQWINDLKNNFSITPRKSLTLEPPKNLSKECELAFIKGYIDGDGCIFKHSKKYLALSIVGTKDVLEWIKNICDKLAFTSRKNLASVKPEKNIFIYRITAKRSLKFLNILHHIPTPELKRKWNKLEEYNYESFLP